MKIGTRSILFGIHQFAIHPWFVAWAWWRLYGFPRDPRLWIAFVIHDWGYWGKANMDGKEGEEHPEWAAKVMGRLFDRLRRTAANVPRVHDRYRTRFSIAVDQTDCMYWEKLCRYHSRFLAKKDGQPYSRLCVADKFAIALQPWWWYLPVAWLSGELKEYMQGKGARTPAGDRSTRKWYRDVQQYCKQWAMEHIGGRPDTWTGTKRDLAMSVGKPREPAE